MYMRVPQLGTDSVSVLQRAVVRWQKPSEGHLCARWVRLSEVEVDAVDQLRGMRPRCCQRTVHALARAQTHTPTHTHTHNAHARTQIHTYIHTYTHSVPQRAFPDKNDLHAMAVITENTAATYRYIRHR